MSRTSLLQDLLSSIATRTGFLSDPRSRRLTLAETARLCHDLVSARGEPSGVRIATQILQTFRQMDAAEADGFFAILADEFGPPAEPLRKAAEAYAATPTPKTLSALQHAAEPPRQELFRRLNLAAGGTAELVRLRERLLPRLKQDPSRLEAVDEDLRHLFQSWFNRGFLVLKRIDWDTPASVLEKIIRYEAVHTIGNWDELRQRLAPGDRRCFAFFHPSIPDDPLIFVEVALTGETPASITEVLDSNRLVRPAAGINTAVFYSISNCHRGLAGISFGSFLIKQVAEDLRADLPGLKTFVTLSPVPGFQPWLQSLDATANPPLDAGEGRALAIIAETGWAADPAKVEAARPGLLALGARFLVKVKRPDGQPRDPVARFHLGNGAMLNRIMHLADPSPRGLAQSAGLMVNYLYDLPKLEQYHEAYAAERQVAASRAVTSLLSSRFNDNPNREPA